MQSSTSDALSVKKLHHDVLVIRCRCPIGMNLCLGYRCVGDLGRRLRQVSGSKHDLSRDMFPTCRSCEKWTWTARICQMLRGHQEAMGLMDWQSQYCAV